MRLQRAPTSIGNRMMAMGGSFGGYMTNWIGTQTQRFKCLITHACVIDDGAIHRHHRSSGAGGISRWAARTRTPIPRAFDRYAPMRHTQAVENTGR